MSQEQIIKDHFRLRRGIGPRDIYKLLYQAEFSAEHMVMDYDIALRFFREEYASAKPGREEPLVEPASDQVYRINLRPFRALVGEEFALYDMFISSSYIERGSNKGMVERIDSFICMNERHNFLQEDRLRGFMSSMIAEGLPSTHHSMPYRKHNNPSYRIVDKGIWERYTS